jgi:hypothetical protein
MKKIEEGERKFSRRSPWPLLCAVPSKTGYRGSVHGVAQEKQKISLNLFTFCTISDIINLKTVAI